jgi:hypothetical protein
VTAGFIVGFDGEKDNAARQITDLIEAAAIPICIVGLLYALPNTQLTRRLMREGRLHPHHDIILDEIDHCAVGLNFDTARPRRDILRDCQQIVETIYDPAAYFARIRSVCLALDCTNQKNPYPLGKNLIIMAKIIWWLTTDRKTARHCWPVLIVCAVRNPRALMSAIKMSALYLHFGPFSKYVVETLERHTAQESSPWQRLPTERPDIAA